MSDDELRETADDDDPIARRILEDDRRRNGAVVREFLGRHRLEPDSEA